MTEKPLAIDLYCGLGGWTDGLLAEGYRVIGYDIEAHEYWMPKIEHSDNGAKGTKPMEKRGWTQGCAVSLGMEGSAAEPNRRLVKYPAELVIQDVLTIHGSQFKDAALIVASPPCQEYSYMAMPWTRAKAIAAEYRSGKRDKKNLTALFDACFRIQREAIEAAGHFIPLVVENVRGAQPWVGRARWNFGSFYLWGDVPALMPITMKRTVMKQGIAHRPNGETNFHGHTKNGGGSWFNIGSPGQKEVNRNPVHELAGVRRINESHRSKSPAKGYGAVTEDGIKNFTPNGEPLGKNTLGRRHGSKSNARKAASATIAKIPLPLSRWIAKCWKPKPTDHLIKP